MRSSKRNRPSTRKKTWKGDGQVTEQKKDKPAVGFIGIGVMGKSMARRLMEAGHSLHVYSRTKAKTDELVAAGALYHADPASLAPFCEVIITMVGYPHDVKEVYLGEQGLVHHAKPGTVLVDMTTSSPALAKRIYEEARSRGLAALDAPVSGGDIGAREGRLSIMVGGDRSVFDNVQDVFKAMGSQIVYQGEAGAGQHTKMCNQIAIASNMMGVCEAIVYADKAGLQPEIVLQSISSGAAGSWSLNQLAPRMLKGDFAPGFYVKHFIKDMAIALQSAEEMNIELPGLKTAKALYDRLAEMGEEDSGTQALFKWYLAQQG
ncbi:NAD(P)-dependent oxidoreductase [Paenibacillus senegalensis]|uniref:NAD(P)-dependent oxidoreductase n=1 Tax=Paenibacillus senegalensis TaxID=1465766 RepID=UPI0009DA8E97|nr:NAD(P)-dependent oxidoreductase [Paenibacillus senegalensis]